MIIKLFYDMGKVLKELVPVFIFGFLLVMMGSNSNTEINLNQSLISVFELKAIIFMKNPKITIGNTLLNIFGINKLVRK